MNANCGHRDREAARSRRAVTSWLEAWPLIAAIAGRPVDELSAVIWQHTGPSLRAELVTGWLRANGHQREVDDVVAVSVAAAGPDAPCWPQLARWVAETLARTSVGEPTWLTQVTPNSFVFALHGAPFDIAFGHDGSLHAASADRPASNNTRRMRPLIALTHR